MAIGQINFFPLLSWKTAGLCLAACAIYYFILGVYRVTLHPLARFPGPKLAAASFWYEFYYDVLLWGRYGRRIKELHEIYGTIALPMRCNEPLQGWDHELRMEYLGPIIRINPIELHCNDPDFTDTIYPVAGRRRNKSLYHMGAWGPK
jgi:hypothetical protein